MDAPEFTSKTVLYDLYKKIPTMWKAVYAGLFAGLLTMSGILIGDTGFGDVSAGQWIAVAIAFLGGAGGTYAIPNRWPPEKPRA